MTRAQLAQAGALLGAVLVTMGVSLVWLPLGLIVAGGFVIGYFLTVFDVDGDT